MPMLNLTSTEGVRFSCGHRVQWAQEALCVEPHRCGSASCLTQTMTGSFKLNMKDCWLYCFYNLVYVNHVYNQKLPNLTSGKRWRSYPGPCWWQAPPNLLGLCRSYLGVKRPDSTNRKIDTLLDDIHFHADAQFTSAANPFDMCLIGYIILPFWQRGYSIIFGWMRSPTSMPMNQPDPSIVRHATSKRDSS